MLKQNFQSEIRCLLTSVIGFVQKTNFPKFALDKIGAHRSRSRLRNFRNSVLIEFRNWIRFVFWHHSGSEKVTNFGNSSSGAIVTAFPNYSKKSSSVHLCRRTKVSLLKVGPLACEKITVAAPPQQNDDKPKIQSESDGKDKTVANLNAKFKKEQIRERILTWCLSDAMKQQNPLLQIGALGRSSKAFTGNVLIGRVLKGAALKKACRRCSRLNLSQNCGQNSLKWRRQAPTSGLFLFNQTLDRIRILITPCFTLPRPENK